MFSVNFPDMNRATIKVPDEELTHNIEEAALASLGFSPRTQIAQVSSDLITHKPVFSLMFEVGLLEASIMRAFRESSGYSVHNISIFY